MTDREVRRDGGSGRAPKPRVYVLIVNWRGWADTIECLESVLRLRYDNVRIVVCDNGSGDDSVDRIRQWASGSLPAPVSSDPQLAALTQPPVPKPLKIAESDCAQAEAGLPDPDESDLLLVRSGKNLGFAGGNNVGIRYALAREDAAYVWLLNNDTVVHPDVLTAMVRHAESDPRIGMAGAKLLYYGDPRRVQAIGGGRLKRWQGLARHVGSDRLDDGSWTAPVDVDVILGACLLVRREVLEEVGLLDEEYFMYSEELDWCWRTLRAGWKLQYSPGGIVWHKVGRSIGYRSPQQEYHAMRGTFLFMRKNLPHLLPAAMLYNVYRSLLPKVVRGQRARAAAVLRAYRDSLRSVPAHPDSTP